MDQKASMPETPNIELLRNAEAFIAAYPPTELFTSRGPEHLVYDGVHRRWRLQLEETGDLGYGLWRDDLLGEAGISGAELDCKVFADTLCETLAPQLSIRMLQYLIEAFAGELSQREADRVRFIATLKAQDTH